MGLNSMIPARPSVRALMEAAGYSVMESGGGCTAWQKWTTPGKAYLMICTEDQGHDDSPTCKRWLVGHHTQEGGYLEYQDALTLAGALRIADRLPDPTSLTVYDLRGETFQISVPSAAFADGLTICAKWIKRLGYGFHPDTRGATYTTVADGVPDWFFSPNEAAEYDADMIRLFAICPEDPYAPGAVLFEEIGLTERKATD